MPWIGPRIETAASLRSANAKYRSTTSSSASAMPTASTRSSALRWLAVSWAGTGAVEVIAAQGTARRRAPARSPADRRAPARRIGAISPPRPVPPAAAQPAPPAPQERRTRLARRRCLIRSPRRRLVPSRNVPGTACPGCTGSSSLVDATQSRRRRGESRRVSSPHLPTRSQRLRLPVAKVAVVTVEPLQFGTRREAGPTQSARTRPRTRGERRDVREPPDHRATRRTRPAASDARRAGLHRGRPRERSFASIAATSPPCMMVDHFHVFLNVAGESASRRPPVQECDEYTLCSCSSRP